MEVVISSRAIRCGEEFCAFEVLSFEV